MKEPSNAQFLGLEHKMYHDHSQLLSTIARNLRSTARSCDLLAKDIEQKSFCARRPENLKKIWSQEPPTLVAEENDRNQIEKIKQRIVKGVMKAANALKQNQIINDAVQSLIAPTIEERSASPQIHRVGKLSEDTIYWIPPEEIKTERPGVPQSGFVTASGWIAINRRQY